MESKQKNCNSEELLCSTCHRTRQRLEELISMIWDIFRLLEQIPAYLEYRKIFDTLQDALEQLQHANEGTDCYITSFRLNSPPPSDLLSECSPEEPLAKEAAPGKPALDPEDAQLSTVLSVPEVFLAAFPTEVYCPPPAAPRAPPWTGSSFLPWRPAP